jgi:hypothetical protein
MTHKLIVLEFIVPTVLAIAPAIVLSVGAVHLTDACLGPLDQAEAHRTIADGHLWGMTVLCDTC